MAGATVSLTSNSFATLYLNNGASQTRQLYSGSGTPWTVASTTPYRIANNDVTGERWAMTAPVPSPIVDGAPPFTAWGRTIGLLYTNRQILIPLQAYATDQQYLGRLLVEIRNRMNAAITQQRVSLTITYDGQSVIMQVEGGTLQEGPQFWNDEEGRGDIRAVLVLTCTPGVGTPSTLQTAATYTNAVPGSTSPYTGLDGDWIRSMGQGLYLFASGGDISVVSAKVLYLASLASSADSGSLSSAISTTSTTGVDVTGNVSIALTASRGTRARFVCQITTPNSALQLRIRVRIGNSSGAILYTGEWISPGTSTTIVDLGYLILSQSLLATVGASLYAIVQARSSTGGSATGTLARIRALDYYTFAKVTIATTGSGESFSGITPQPGIAGAGTADGVDMQMAAMQSSGTTVQICEIAGQLPRAIEGMALWAAWTSGGVFDSADTISLSAVMLPIYETLPAP